MFPYTVWDAEGEEQEVEKMLRIFLVVPREPYQYQRRPRTVPCPSALNVGYAKQENRLIMRRSPFAKTAILASYHTPETQEFQQKKINVQEAPGRLRLANGRRVVHRQLESDEKFEAYKKAPIHGAKSSVE